jgi:betaine-aldehyde dehydrogenase
VAGVIAPWNSPVALVVRSLAPALAAGCAAAVMLPRQTALVNALIAQLIADTEELPRGVVNISSRAATRPATCWSPRRTCR